MSVYEPKLRERAAYLKTQHDERYHKLIDQNLARALLMLKESQVDYLELFNELSSGLPAPKSKASRKTKKHGIGRSRSRR